MDPQHDYVTEPAPRTRNRVLATAGIAAAIVLAAGGVAAARAATAPPGPGGGPVLHERYTERQPVSFVSDAPMPRREFRTNTVDVWARPDGSGRVHRDTTGTATRLGAGAAPGRPAPEPADSAVGAGGLGPAGPLAGISDPDAMASTARTGGPNASNPAAAFDRIAQVSAATGATDAQRRTARSALSRVDGASNPEQGVYRITERGDGRVIEREVRLDDDDRLVSDTSTLVADPGGTYGQLPVVVYSRTRTTIEHVSDVPTP